MVCYICVTFIDLLNCSKFCCIGVVLEMLLYTLLYVLILYLPWLWHLWCAQTCRRVTNFFVCLFCCSCVGSHRLVILSLEWVNISRWSFSCGYIVYLRSIAEDVCAAGLPLSQVCVSWFCLFAEECSVHVCALGCSSLTGQSGNQMGFSVGTLLFACHYHSSNNPYSLYPCTLNAV
jgi:hypothetical protein